MSPRVRAILLNYNGYSDTVECLASLAAQEGVNCRPLVVDNGSHDRSAERLRCLYPDVDLIETGANLGFAAGNNVAIEAALTEDRWDYLFLVNNDTAMEPDCVARLVASAAANPQAAVVNPAIYWYADRNRPWFVGSTVDWRRGRTGHEYLPLEDDRARAPFEVPWCTGCAMLIPVERMRALGGLDARYFCYFEDSDWSFRAEQAGYRCLLEPRARLYHKVSATASKKQWVTHYYMGRNRLLCFATHGRGRSEPPVRMAARMAARRARDLVRRARGVDADRAEIRWEFVGMLDFFRGRFGPCPYRLAPQRGLDKVPAEAVVVDMASATPSSSVQGGSGLSAG